MSSSSLLRKSHIAPIRKITTMRIKMFELVSALVWIFFGVT
jgi:hypothetical protein